ncbi:hypothetical protein AMECASPLE_023088 [Ameca splendens]|uniref:Uncharacterized protein n=1 Tax=Ameca splendens TaxID=208324 RepID=A0ABV0YQX5_9TELE
MDVLYHHFSCQMMAYLTCPLLSDLLPIYSFLITSPCQYFFLSFLTSLRNLLLSLPVAAQFFNFPSSSHHHHLSSPVTFLLSSSYSQLPPFVCFIWVHMKL